MSRVLSFDQNVTGRQAILHLRFAGGDRDIVLAVLGIDRASTDAQVQKAVAAYLELPSDEFSRCLVRRHANGNLTLQPCAVSNEARAARRARF